MWSRTVSCDMMLLEMMSLEETIRLCAPLCVYMYVHVCLCVSVCVYVSACEPFFTDMHIVSIAV